MADFQDNQTFRLLKAIGSPLFPNSASRVPEESKELFDFAFKNKMPLMYLETLNKQGKLHNLIFEYETQFHRYRETLITVSNIARLFNDTGIEYIVYKTLRLFPATPNDVDVIILGSPENFELL